MKYVLGICNLFGALFLGYVIFITSSQIEALNAAYDTLVNKYKTEDAAEVAYLSEVYHLGDWTTILTDMLSLQYGTGLTEEARVKAVSHIGTAISFEETLCSYLAGFEEGVTTIINPYILCEDTNTTLLTDISLTSGTLINHNSKSSLNLNTRDDLIAAYRKVKNIDDCVADKLVYKSMEYARADLVNDIIKEARGHTGYGEQDKIYIPIFEDSRIVGVNPIINQALLVLNSTDKTNAATTLAGYTKVAKRQYCTISGPAGNFYCYSDELPAGYIITNTYDTEAGAAKAPNIIGRYYIGYETR